MSSLPRPIDRSDFRLAIICALPREADAVILLFDQFWDEEGIRYGRAEGDRNHYKTGRIGQHDVVLAVLPGMGTQNAAAAGASLRSSYSGLKVAFLVGICGAVPKIDGVDVMLGDVIISKRIVQYDSGRQYPGHFVRRPTLVGRDSDLLGLLSTINITHERERLQGKAREHLKHLQRAVASTEFQNGRQQRVSYSYPGLRKDKLYQSDYIHRHKSNCRQCRKGVCDTAWEASCTDLGCERSELVSRNVHGVNNKNYLPKIFLGRVGSANTVMKSGQHRDRIAREHNLIAFEMEGAGIWDQVPCLVIKGVCDYADSHKNNTWQNFAAATAASVMKAVLQSWPVSTQLLLCHTIPYTRNLKIVKRQELEDKLNTLLPRTSPYAAAALWGLGGSGKTQIALEYAYQRLDANDSFVFWVHADTGDSFMHDYKNIARKLSLGAALNGKQLLKDVRNKIESLSSWVLIIDNADDLTIFGSGDGTRSKLNLKRYIPRSARQSGTVIWTSRDENIVWSLVGPERGIEITGMINFEARVLLGITTNTMNEHKGAQADKETHDLLQELQWLALPISQAGAFMRRTSTSAGEYLGLLLDDRQRWKLLKSSAAVWDQSRNRMGVSDSVLDTWRISIECILRENELAYHILHVLSYVDNQNISRAMIEEAARYHGRHPPRDQKTRVDYVRQKYVIDDDGAGLHSIEVLTAISRLMEFSFIRIHREREGKRNYEIHKLVQDAAQNGLQIKSRIEYKNNSRDQMDQQNFDSEAYFSGVALQVISDLYPQREDNARHQAEKYLAHAMRVIKWAEVCSMPHRTASLIDRLREFILGRVVDSEESKLKLAKDALALRRPRLGDGHPDTLFSMLEVARSNYDLRDFNRAEKQAIQLYSLQRKVLARTDPHIIQTLLLKADAIFAQDGRRYEAEEILSRVTDHLRHVGMNNMMLGHAMYHRACMRLSQDDCNTALSLALSAIDVLQQCAPSPHYIWSMRLAAEIYMQSENYSKAVPTLRRALAHSQEVLGTERTTIGLKISLAFSHLNMAHYDEAGSLAGEAAREGRAMFGSNDHQTLKAKDLCENIEIAQQHADIKTIRRIPSSSLQSPVNSSACIVLEEYQPRFRALLSRASEKLGNRLSTWRGESFARAD